MRPESKSCLWHGIRIPGQRMMMNGTITKGEDNGKK